MRKDFGVKTWFYPMPVMIVATYSEDGKANLMNAAWGGVVGENRIAMCIDKGHKTFDNLEAKKAFTISFGTVDTVKSCDYVGLVSGKKEPNKVEKSGFTLSSSANVDAPIVNELPLTIECEVETIDGEIVIGRIVNVSADESILTEGKVDISKLKPITFDSARGEYVALGEDIAKAFKVGRTI